MVRRGAADPPVSLRASGAMTLKGREQVFLAAKLINQAISFEEIFQTDPGIAT
jgi:hypothetical protein